MFKTLTILLFVILITQYSFGQLNNQIYKSQKIAILESPFKNAKKVTREISIQKKARQNYLGIIDSLKLVFPHDSILLIEIYTFNCINCPAAYV